MEHDDDGVPHATKESLPLILDKAGFTVGGPLMMYVAKTLLDRHGATPVGVAPNRVTMDFVVPKTVTIETLFDTANEASSFFSHHVTAYNDTAGCVSVTMTEDDNGVTPEGELRYVSLFRHVLCLRLYVISYHNLL